MVCELYLNQTITSKDKQVVSIHWGFLTSWTHNFMAVCIPPHPHQTHRDRGAVQDALVLKGFGWLPNGSSLSHHVKLLHAPRSPTLCTGTILARNALPATSPSGTLRCFLWGMVWGPAPLECHLTLPVGSASCLFLCSQTGHTALPLDECLFAPPPTDEAFSSLKVEIKTCSSECAPDLAKPNKLNEKAKELRHVQCVRHRDAVRTCAAVFNTSESR